jgi:hypothetical protein
MGATMLSSVRPTVTVLVAGFILSPVNGQTWSGNAGNGSWNNTGNWVGSTIPNSSTTTAIILTGTTQLATTQDIANPFSLNSLTFDAAAGAFSIGGNPLQFNGTAPALVQNSANSIAITSLLTFSTSGSIGGTGIGTLTTNGVSVQQATLSVNHSVTVNSPGVTVAGGGTLEGTSKVSGFITLSGRIQGGDGVTATGDPTLTVSGIQFLGSASTLQVAVGGASQATVVNSKVAATGAFGPSLALPSTLGIHLVNDGTLNLNGGTTYTITVLTYGSTTATPSNLALFADNFTFSGLPVLNFGPTSTSVQFTPVPEPVAVFGLSFAGLYTFRVIRNRIKINRS